MSWGDEEIAEEQAFTAHFFEFRKPLLGSRSGQSTKQGRLKKRGDREAVEAATITEGRLCGEGGKGFEGRSCQSSCNRRKGGYGL